MHADCTSCGALAWEPCTRGGIRGKPRQQLDKPHGARLKLRALRPLMLGPEIPNTMPAGAIPRLYRDGWRNDRSTKQST
jgi:hypothetical protein